MRILAIDPGTKESAILRWIHFPGTAYQGRIEAKETLPNALVLSSLAFYSVGTIDAIGIEMVASYGMAVGREVFETCVWIGRFYQACPFAPRLIYRKEVCLHHCHSARADDSNVRRALIDKYGPPGIKKAPGLTYGVSKHLWSALAIATFISETA